MISASSKTNLAATFLQLLFTGGQSFETSFLPQNWLGLLLLLLLLQV
jgi:hypothetical protein